MVTVGLTLGVGLLGLSRSGWVVLPLLLVWGASAATLPVVLQSAALRVSAGSGESASGAYVLAYQVGIASGSAAGAAFLGHGSPAHLPLLSAVWLLAGTGIVVGALRTFGGRGPDAAPGGTMPV